MATLASVFSKGTRLGKNIWCRTKVKRLIIYVTAMVCFVVSPSENQGLWNTHYKFCCRQTVVYSTGQSPYTYSTNSLLSNWFTSPILSSFYILTVTMLQFYKFNPKIKAADLKILINTQDLSLHKIQKLHNLNSLIHSEMPLIPEACIKQSIF